MDDFNYSGRLRSLPLPGRIVIAVFLCSVGIGYLSALVQLHFQEAAAGQVLPGDQEVVAAYYGRAGQSQLERVLTADASRPFNGSGSMATAFTTRSGGLKRALRDKVAELHLDLNKPAEAQKAREELFKERNGERLAIVAWIQSGDQRNKSYAEDSFRLPRVLASHPITSKYIDPDTHHFKVQSVFTDRCVRCHSESAGGSASNFPLDTIEHIDLYCQAESVSGGMSLTKLAQTTHVHLLGFAMLYGLTGLAFALTSYPAWLRVLIGPWPLIAQVLDISCWWLARWDPHFASAIRVTGGAVAIGLLAQIVLTLADLFGKRGRFAVIVLVVLAGAGGVYIQQHWLMPYLQLEAQGMTPESAASP